MTTSRTKKYGCTFACLMIVFVPIFVIIMQPLTESYASEDVDKFLSNTLGPAIIFALLVAIFGTLYFVCQEE